LKVFWEKRDEGRESRVFRDFSLVTGYGLLAELVEALSHTTAEFDYIAENIGFWILTYSPFGLWPYWFVPCWLSCAAQTIKIIKPTIGIRLIR
jgi:hypothetical protein